MLVQQASMNLISGGRLLGWGLMGGCVMLSADFERQQIAVKERAYFRTKGAEASWSHL